MRIGGLCFFVNVPVFCISINHFGEKVPRIKSKGKAAGFADTRMTSSNQRLSWSWLLLWKYVVAFYVVIYVTGNKHHVTDATMTCVFINNATTTTMSPSSPANVMLLACQDSCCCNVPQCCSCDTSNTSGLTFIPCHFTAATPVDPLPPLINSWTKTVYPIYEECYPSTTSSPSTTASPTTPSSTKSSHTQTTTTPGSITTTTNPTTTLHVHPTPNKPQKSKAKDKDTGLNSTTTLALAIVMGLLILVMAIIALLICCKKKNHKKARITDSSEIPSFKIRPLTARGPNSTDMPFNVIKWNDV